MSNVDIPPFLTYVRSEYLYTDDLAGYFTPATIFAFSCVLGKPKFSILTENKKVFHNVEVNALTNSKNSAPVSINEHIFSHKENIEIYKYQYLYEINNCLLLDKDGVIWQGGNYLFSLLIDNNSIQFHFIELNDGNYIFWPNENTIWGNEIHEQKICVEK